VNNWAPNFCLPLHARHHEAAPQMESSGAKTWKNFAAANQTFMMANHEPSNPFCEI